MVRGIEMPSPEAHAAGESGQHDPADVYARIEVANDEVVLDGIHDHGAADSQAHDQG
jgi:outer membrane receptor for monomeric catechols